MIPSELLTLCGSKHLAADQFLSVGSVFRSRARPDFSHTYTRQTTDNNM